MYADIEKVLFSKEDIAARVAEIGAELDAKYGPLTADGQPVVVISILRGAAIFHADLIRAMTIPVEIDFMATSSYGCSTVSCGEVTIKKDLDTNIEGRHVIIAEDVLDSGLTLGCLIEMLKVRKPASISVVAMLRKDNPDQRPVPCEIVGYECPNEFLVGYGLDYAERYRNLPFVGVLKCEVYS